MSDKLPISAFIIAKNEADRILYTLESIKNIADEIIVIDSGSTDNTVEICKKAGAKVIFNEWQGYGPQKNFGESLCKYDWILNLDADEALDADLQKYMQNLKAENNPEYDVYIFKVVTVSPHNNKFSKHGPHNHCIRFYNKEKAHYRNSTVHDSVIAKTNEPLKSLKVKDGLVMHRCFRSYAHMIEKINFYSSMQAADWLKKNRKVSNLRIIIEPFFAFFKSYFLRRYFLWGIDGFIEAVIYACGRTLRLAKCREAQMKCKEGWY